MKHHHESLFLSLEEIRKRQAKSNRQTQNAIILMWAFALFGFGMLVMFL